MFSVSVNMAEFLAARAYMDHQVDRASMYALRETGREVIAEARGAVPVLSGRLQRSITNDRQIKGGGHSFTLNTGPHGDPAFLYAGKIEALHPYMGPAIASAEGKLSGIFERAQATALARFA